MSTGYRLGTASRMVCGPLLSGRLEAVPSRSLVVVAGGSLAWERATKQGHVIGAAEPKVEFPEQFSWPVNVRGPCQA